MIFDQILDIPKTRTAIYRLNIYNSKARIKSFPNQEKNAKISAFPCLFVEASITN